MYTMTDPLQKALETIVRISDPDRVILFGSRARDSETPESDYDLLVLKKGVKKRRRLAQKIYLNFVQIGAPIDIIISDLLVYEELKKDTFHIFNIISFEGIIIYDKSRGD